MARGECQELFRTTAAGDGVVLDSPSKVPWLNQRGHLGLPDEAERSRDALAQIFRMLGGDVDAQATKNLTALEGDFVHPASGALIEVDEHQHFTSYRLLTLDFYPNGIAVGFDVEEYRDLCNQLKAKADKAFAHRSARGFGPQGRPRQRACVDALRDLVAPAMGRPPVIRAPAPDDDGAAAYVRVRDRVRSTVGLA